MAFTDKLTAIANAIRSKTGKTETMTLDQMPMEIESISSGGLEPQAFDNLDEEFQYSAFVMLLKQLGEGVITEIRVKGYLPYAFEGAPDIGFKIPDVVYYGTSQTYIASMFYDSKIKAENLPKIVSTQSIYSIDSLFKNSAIEYVPEDFFDYMKCEFNNRNNGASSVFSNCNRIRTIPKKVLEKLYNKFGSWSGSNLYYEFNNCHVLDEVDGVAIKDTTNTATSNLFSNTFDNCHRLKRIVFSTNQGNPYIVKMKSQTINLSKNVGYASTVGRVTFNSNITTASQVTDGTSYNNLKNTEDWFTIDVNYSRYNRTSAVETINSLPDTSAYLASAGGTNTIKFNGSSGASTDGGAINTMTAEEIAVATAKGWTVTFV